MKCVYFGYDFMIGCARRLLEDGHTLAGIFTFPCDNVFNFNGECLALAQQLNIPITQDKPQPADIDFFINQGVECFISAGYPFKIPPIDPLRACGINIHPSLLPQGRGLMPTPYILTQHPEIAGFTIHKLSNEFDKGDILHQMAIPVSDQETVETLSARIALRAPDMLSMVLSDLPFYWSEAKPQNERKASYFPPPTETMRTLDWSQSVQEIDKTARAFGRYGSLAQFDGDLWVVYDHDVWAERHHHKPGNVVLRLSREVTIAAKDGYVCLKEFHRAGVI